MRLRKADGSGSVEVSPAGAGPARHALRGRHGRVRGLAAAVVATLVASVFAVVGITSPARAGTVWPGGTWAPDPETYGITVVKDVPVTMDDGVVLPADIGYPTDRLTGKRAAGTFPVIVQQNPYVFGGDPDSFFVSRGYIFVSVDVRGTNRSQAPDGGPLVNPLFGPRIAKDGTEVVDWAAHKLDGSNGTIGLYGCSQLGINQLFTAAAVGPHSPVQAIIPACASNSYDIYFAGGVPSATVPLFGQDLGLSGDKHAAENLAYGQQLVAEINASGPRAYHSSFWQERTTDASMAASIVKNGIPALLWSGWQATENPGALHFYAALQNAANGRPAAAPLPPGQSTTGRYQLVLGNWGHGSGLDKSIELEWYDTWLKHRNTGIAATKTPLHLYEQGSNRWVKASGYPLVTNYIQYYLNANSALTAGPPGASGTDQVTYAAPDQSGSTLTYTTSPFVVGQTLAGPIDASIYASSSNQNINLIATLQDVPPSGSPTTISSGSLIGTLSALDGSASWKDSAGRLILPVHPYTADKAVVPGAVNRYDIRINPTAWGLAPLHLLRLVISTQASKDDCSGLLGMPQPCAYTAAQQASLAGGSYQIARNSAGRSVVNLPLLPWLQLPTARSGATPTSGLSSEPLGW
ncbi:CocE/NonD family hydrolase [Frankia sp. AgB32]|uniref:CocE/NonD family hydrolase n=1 Tax=Frankia sp. AgB32 TaxID=631119 RepID=UPI00200D7EB6|nr:CocE/NonD family hydrolase [Frankia sp. AgB32]MCK9898237.1 CocE/NonD family hydrolase [Frankia sp. AgB32]